MVPFVSAQTLNGYVTDNSGIFSPAEERALISALKQLEQDTSVQFVIFITDTIPDDYDLESYSLKIAEDNNIGQKGKDNGLLFFLATKDRKYRWEVGYGIEDVLNTPLMGRISRIYMVPYFQEGRFSQGVMEGAGMVIKVLLNSTDEDVQALKKPLNRSLPSKERIISILIVLAFFFVLPAIFRFRRRGRLHDTYYIGAGMMMFSGGFGRNFGRGGFGGFSGGGGSFGGGGFSGGF